MDMLQKWGELGPNLTQCGRGWGLPPCQVSSWSIQPFGHNTPMSQTGQLSDSIGKLFYKRSPKNCGALAEKRPLKQRWWLLR